MELNTEFLSEDGDYLYYTAQLDHFIYFVIGEKTSAENLSDVNKEQIKKTPGFRTIIILIGILAVFAVIVIVAILLRIKRKNKKK